MNLVSCPSLTSVPEKRTWFRAIQPQHQATALQTSHTPRIPSRFSEGRNVYEILYLAESPMVALFEVQAMLGSPLHGVTVPNPYQAWTVLNVDVALCEVADLTDVANQALIQTSAQELTGDWRSYAIRGGTTAVSGPTGAAPTQELGDALYKNTPFEGFRTVSAKFPISMILGVFPKKLSSESGLVIKDHTGRVIQRIP